MTEALVTHLQSLNEVGRDRRPSRLLAEGAPTSGIDAQPGGVEVGWKEGHPWVPLSDRSRPLVARTCVLAL